MMCLRACFCNMFNSQMHNISHFLFWELSFLTLLTFWIILFYSDITLPIWHENMTEVDLADLGVQRNVGSKHWHPLIRFWVINEMKMLKFKSRLPFKRFKKALYFKVWKGYLGAAIIIFFYIGKINWIRLKANPWYTK
jgi:hypothetical protein